MNSSSFFKQYGQWALITGASDGIGKATAIELAKLGFSLILVARREHLLIQLSHELKQHYGTDCRMIVTDLTHRNSIKIILEQTANIEIGLLVTAAGFGSSGYFTDNQLEEELNMIDVNCRSVVNLSHYFSQYFKAQKRGGIILYSSIVAFQGVAFSTNYAATKAFIQSFGEGLYRELKPYGVDVLIVAPAPVDTGFGQRAKLNIDKNAEKPCVIAKESVAALGKKITVRPGRLAKLLGYSLNCVPRFLRIIIMSNIMANMAKGVQS